MYCTTEDEAATKGGGLAGAEDAERRNKKTGNNNRAGEQEGTIDFGTLLAIGLAHTRIVTVLARIVG